MRTYAPATTDAVLARLLGGAVARPRRRPSRGHPRTRGGVWRDAPAARPADRGRRCASRGIERLYTHQAEAVERGARRPGRRRRHAHGLGQVAVLRAAHPPVDRRRSGRPGTRPLPHQGPGPGPGRGVRAARPGGRPDDLHGGLRRRHARRPSDRRSARPGRSSSPTRTCSTRRSCPTTPSGSSCSSSCGSSSSTSSTRTAACSGATSRTSSGGCCGCAATTARTPSSCAARRRSGTRRSWPRRSSDGRCA